MKTKEFNCENKIELSGEIVEDIVLDHTMGNTKFYSTTLKIERKSKTNDYLPIIIKENVLKNIKGDLKIGTYVQLEGTIRTHNQIVTPEIINPNTGRPKTKLCVRVYASNIKITDKTETSTNEVYITGFISNKPTYRKTPLGRNICDIMVAVNSKQLNRSSYIPTICWGKDAKFISNIETGAKIKLTGRLQSRCYTKTDPDTKETTEYVTYEISAAHISLIEG
jgi:single-stranded DNA-binding protein